MTDEKMAVSLKCGAVGERIAWDLLIHEPWVREVIDVRDDERMRNADIDFMVYDTKRQVRWVEVKADRVAIHTNRLAYEKTTSGNVGCLEKTKADYIMYYIIPDGGQRGRMLIMPTKRLKEYARECSLPEVQMGNNATGYLFPIQELIDREVITKVWEL